jgi:hypothetical protein
MDLVAVRGQNCFTMRRSTARQFKPLTSPGRLERLSDLEALLRESVKTIVIVIYLGFAIWLLLSTGEPYGFAPLLPWALWSRNELRKPP